MSSAQDAWFWRPFALSGGNGVAEAWTRSAVLACAVALVLAGCEEGGHAAADQSIRSLAGGHPVVVIFNHGTNDSRVRHTCNERRDIPLVLRRFAGAEKLQIHYLCSKATNRSRERSYTYDRALEIAHVIYQYRAKGIPARNIFLMGQSAGAWSALIAARRYGDRFNALIGFAPAFHGTRAYWKKRGYRIKHGRVPRMQAIQAHEIAAGRVNALIYAFPKDNYNAPEHLAFLKKIPGVEFIVTGACRAGHSTGYTPCFADAEFKRIRNFIAQRLKKAQLASR